MSAFPHSISVFSNKLLKLHWKKSSCSFLLQEDSSESTVVPREVAGFSLTLLVSSGFVAFYVLDEKLIGFE